MLLHLRQFWAWTLANPTYAWPIVSAMIVLLLKPRTPEQYTDMAKRSPVWFWARFTPMLQLIGALGLDPVKALQAAKKIFTGKVAP